MEGLSSSFFDSQCDYASSWFTQGNSKMAPRYVFSGSSGALRLQVGNIAYARKQRLVRIMQSSSWTLLSLLG